MGQVFLVERKSDGKSFALKQVNKAFINKINKIHHVYIEKLLLSNLQHESIVQLVETLQDEHFLYFLLEFLSNGTLSELMEEKIQFKN